MITPADTGEVISLIAVYHHRTAPRVDDADVFRFTATAWAKLFNIHNLELQDLLAAVEKRAAAGHIDAPEPAEIIAFAREIRRDRTDRTGPTPEYEQLCESKAEDHAELESNRNRLAALIQGVADRTTIDR